MSPYSLLFLSGAEISLPLLRALAKDPRFQICGVICQPDKPVGRTMEIKCPAPKTLAEKLGVEVFQTEKLSADGALFSHFKTSRPDIILTFAFGQILNEDWLKLPKFALNVHASLLPKYRGASPISAAILNGDTVTGLAVMKMEAAMDKGPVAFIHEIEIPPHMTTGLLHDEVAEVAAKVVPDEIVKLMEALNEARDLFKEQDESQATYTKKMTREDGMVNFKEPAELILRKFRAYSPWPGLYTFFKGKRLKFVDIEKTETNSTEMFLAPGEIKVDGKKVYIGTSDGSILLKMLQLEGKDSVYSEQFLLGYPDFSGATLPS